MSYSLSTQKTYSATLDDLAETFRLWRVRDWTVTPTRPMSRATYESEEDRTVTLRFSPNGGAEVVLTMSKQQRAADNLRVLWLVAESLRKNELRGMGDVMREAYLQLPAPATVRDPYEILGVRPDAGAEIIDAAYKARAKVVHTDVGGTHEEMVEVNEAYERIKKEREVAG